MSTEPNGAWLRVLSIVIVRRPSSGERPSEKKTFTITVCGPFVKRLARKPVSKPGAMLWMPG